MRHFDDVFQTFDNYRLPYERSYELSHSSFVGLWKGRAG